MLCVSNYFVTCKGVTQENVITVQIETQVIKYCCIVHLFLGINVDFYLSLSAYYDDIKVEKP